MKKIFLLALMCHIQSIQASNDSIPDNSEGAPPIPKVPKESYLKQFIAQSLFCHPVIREKIKKRLETMENKLKEIEEKIEEKRIHKEEFYKKMKETSDKKNDSSNQETVEEIIKQSEKQAEENKKTIGEDLEKQESSIADRLKARTQRKTKRKETPEKLLEENPMKEGSLETNPTEQNVQDADLSKIIDLSLEETNKDLVESNGEEIK